MKVYFVRHGATDLLKEGKPQLDWTPLSETGKKQAKQIAARFKGVLIEKIITSNLLRAVETAKEIGKLTGIEVIESELFMEVRKPKELYGLTKDDDEARKIYHEINNHLDNPNWHYSNEENFFDAKKRGLEALSLLINLEVENVIVVTHANYLTLLTALMMGSDNFKGENYMKLRSFLRLSNTGVTICNYKEGKWTLECWNDTSHRLE